MRHSGHLVLSVDFEIFGNGTGSVLHCACAPLSRMANLAESHGGRLEIFVEALEFAVMESNPTHKSQVATVREQLVDLVNRGHFLQMHLHPQWANATLREGKWVVDPSHWRIGDLDRRQIERIVAEGRAWLQAVLLGLSSGHSCSVFRAGGWCVQPSGPLVDVLRSHGFGMDSSVAPGQRNRDANSWYDFRGCPDAPWWQVDGDVTRPGLGNFIETPIATGQVPLVKNIVSRLARSRAGELARDCCGSYEGRSARTARLKRLWHKVLTSDEVMLDFCTLPADLMIAVVAEWVDRYGGGTRPVPVVAIGHTKNFSPSAERELDKFLDWVTGTRDLRIGSYASWRPRSGIDVLPMPGFGPSPRA